MEPSEYSSADSISRPTSLILRVISPTTPKPQRYFQLHQQHQTAFHCDSDRGERMIYEWISPLSIKSAQLSLSHKPRLWVLGGRSQCRSRMLVFGYLQHPHPHPSAISARLLPLIRSDFFICHPKGDAFLQ